VEKPAGYGVYATALSDWGSDDLLLASSLVADLRDHPGWEIIERLITQRREHEMVTLIHGPSRSKSEYTERMGRLSGMESSLRAVDAVLYAAESREREEQASAEADAREGAIA
jgi:hypothetical protein